MASKSGASKSSSAADIVREYQSLHRECHGLFSQLGTLPEYGSHHWQPFFTRAFAAFSRLWKLQREHRDTLMAAGALSRLRVGEIANRIAQLYGHYYTRTGNPTYLKQALSFYQSIHDRGYFNKPAATDSTSAVKDGKPSTGRNGSSSSSHGAGTGTSGPSKDAETTAQADVSGTSTHTRNDDDDRSHTSKRTHAEASTEPSAEQQSKAAKASTGNGNATAFSAKAGGDDDDDHDHDNDNDNKGTVPAAAKKGGGVPPEVTSAYLTSLIPPPEEEGPPTPSDASDAAQATADDGPQGSTARRTRTKAPTPPRDLGETTVVPPANPRKPTRAIINPPLLEGVWNEERVLRYYARFAVTALLLYGNCPHRGEGGAGVQCSSNLCSLLRGIRAKVHEIASPERAKLWEREFDAAVAMGDAITSVNFPCRRAKPEAMAKFDHRTHVREVLVVDSRSPRHAATNRLAFSEITLNILFHMQLFEIAPGTKADDLHAHKAGLHMPDVTQLLAFSSIALRELPANSMFVLNISADASPENDALVLETEKDGAIMESKLYPQDLAFLIRTPLLLIIESPAADAFLQLSVSNKHGMPLFLITAPGPWPAPWQQFFPCSCLTAFLADPFVAFQGVVQQLGGPAAEMAPHRKEYDRLLEVFMRSLRDAQREPVRTLLQDFFLLRLLAHAIIAKRLLHGTAIINVVCPINLQGVDTHCETYLQALVAACFQQMHGGQQLVATMAS
ncbi:hypothetical protein PTSG_11870 [Salpingoeca rosetta]|uniref:Uncharacterized protein n=1 Tax=Salpingoeca rosetta (strain ATCC 50818 / BSB-021) TaxID=946362 RepID=F2U1W3_SALR5|nr:uncharacterized protein PTSG_11870 [Salpingoeca rosetta]EGD81615.1 hypothetical protein PTSG_11870 [Salpingoeca rosetta]|eukprot:XP_004996819.1 hypothetical protein PTSG_11870 [Salpingoeca rosetta]